MVLPRELALRLLGLGLYKSYLSVSSHAFIDHVSRQLRTIQLVDFLVNLAVNDNFRAKLMLRKVR